jgi:tetratricopeptide (TPR) repeat protein
MGDSMKAIFLKKIEWFQKLQPYEKAILLVAILTFICAFVAVLISLIPYIYHEDNNTIKSNENQITYLVDDAKEKIINNQYIEAISKLTQAEQLNSLIDKKYDKEKQNLEIQMLLGGCYINLSKIRDKKLNAKKAKDSYEKVKDNIYLLGDPQKIANLKKDLGIAYCLLSEVEDKEPNLIKSINLHEEALEIYKKYNASLNCAAIRDCLGIEWRHLSEIKDSKQNLYRAKENHSDALSIRQNDNLFTDDAISQNNLGVVYKLLAEIENDPYLLEMSIHYFDMAKKNSTFNSLEYAEIMNNIASDYYSRFQFSQQKDDLDRSLENYTKVLNIFTKIDYPLYYADALYKIAMVNVSYSEMDKDLSNRKNLLEAAIKNIEEAGQTFKNEFLFVDFARTKHNEGTIYVTLYKITNEKNYLNKARVEFEVAYNEIPSYRDCGFDFAQTSFYLGDVYLSLSEIDKCEENTRKAINAYNVSKNISEREGLPILSNVNYSLDSANRKSCL